MMQVWTVICVLLCAFYVLLIAYFFIGWMLVVRRSDKKSATTASSETLPGFSILIAARNEGKIIQDCLHSLVQQQYENGTYEIIVVDDHSSDNTAEQVEAYIRQHPNDNIRLVKSQLEFKKASITLGIQQARHDYIVLSDADCTHSPQWLSALAVCIVQNRYKMIYAPVRFKARSLFEKMQALEFAGLVGIGGASMELKNPNMCSAANLVFEKNVFNEVNGYEDNHHIISGDDEFLMHKVFKKYPEKVRFLLNYDAMVTTGASSTLPELAEQRKRWVSKARHYSNRYITLILALAYLFNVSIVLNLALALFQFQFLKIALLQLLLKSLIEFIFLSQVTRHLKQFHLMYFMPVAAFLHLFYVLYIGIAGTFGSFNWKGRHH